MKKKRQRKWSRAAVEKRRREVERAEQLFPYLKLPCFKDPFTVIMQVHSDGTGVGVPGPERIRECCEAILAHAPRPPVHSGLVTYDGPTMTSPAPPGKANSPWSP